MHCLFAVVVISLEQVVIILLQAKVDGGNRVATSCSNKTCTGCS
jgi:hypothetical protein